MLVGDLNLLFAIIAASITAFLGFLVFLHSRKSATSIIFIAHSLVGTAWTFANYFSLVASPVTALFWIRLVMAFAAPYVVLFLLFTLNFPNEELRVRRSFFYGIIALMTILIVMALSSGVFESIAVTNGKILPLRGPLVSIFGGILIITLLISAIKIVRSYLKTPSSNPVKFQWLSIGFGLLLAFSLLIFFVFVRVALLHDTTFVPYSPLFILPIFIGTAFAILRFRLFNMKVVAAETLTFALLLISIIGLISAESLPAKITSSTVVLLVLLFGILLIRSVLKEVEQKEHLQKLSEELARANDKLKQLDKQKSEFLSFASHDLKSPIALIKQFASLIFDGTYKEPEKVHETVLKIKNTADRAVNMVNTFLDLRKIEEGHMEYNFEKKNLVDFVGGITSDFVQLAKQQKNIEVSFSSTTKDIEATIDTTTFRQVIQNFLDNSLKYTEAGWIKVRVAEEQKSVLITISDSGLGMDKDLLPILFEQFRRDPSVAKKIQGTGLGLFISKQIVQAHHGDTWAESEGKGKGSTFFIRIPKA